MIATKQKTIRVGIDGGDYYPDSLYKSGIERLVGSFTKSIKNISTPKLEWFYYYFGQKKYTSQTEKIIYKKLNTRFFSSLFLPFNVLFDRARLYLGFSGILPPFLRFFSKKSIVFIHDFGFYQNPCLYHDSSKMKWECEYAIYGADKIVVFSEYIKKQLFEYFPTIKIEKIVRIYPGVDHLPTGTGIKVKEPFFLYVGVIKPAKNIENLILLFDKFLKKTNNTSTKLLLIGTKEKAYYHYLLQSKIFIKNKKRIEFLENIPDGELTSYYQNCQALLNYSHEEGFCYPVLEALHIGVKVIVNNISLYHEFIPYFNNLFIAKNEEEFIEYMLRVPNQKKISPKKSAHPFYWNKFTEGVLKIIYQTI